MQYILACRHIKRDTAPKWSDQAGKQFWWKKHGWGFRFRGGRKGERGTLPIGLFYLGFIFLCHPTYSPFAKPIYRQLWDNFKTALRKLRGNFETILRQLWDDFETTLGQLWDNFETTRNIYGTILRQLQDNLETFQTFLSIYNSRSCGGAPTIQHYMLDCPLEMLFMFSTLRSPDFCLAYSKNSYFT